MSLYDSDIRSPSRDRVNGSFWLTPINGSAFAHGLGALGGLLWSPIGRLDHALDRFSRVVPPKVHYSHPLHPLTPTHWIASSVKMQPKWFSLMGQLLTICIGWSLQAITIFSRQHSIMMYDLFVIPLKIGVYVYIFWQILYTFFVFSFVLMFLSNFLITLAHVFIGYMKTGVFPAMKKWKIESKAINALNQYFWLLSPIRVFCDRHLALAKPS